MLGLLLDTLRIYRKHISMVLFFSLTFLISLGIQIVSPAPVYLALGGYFLRTGSLPTLSLYQTISVFLFSAVSLFFLSIALVSITLIVKVTKTRTKIGMEAIRNLGNYTIAVFSLFLIVKVIETLIILFSVQYALDELYAIIFTFVASLGLFYSTPAIVLEERKPVQAFLSSYNHIVRKPLHFIAWIVLAFLLLGIVTHVVYTAISEVTIRQILVVLINALLILPLLIIFMAEIYLTKYTIIER
jgi:hypothetical protein